MSARGRTILITAQPQGRFHEGTVYGTPKPGTVMSIKTPFYEGGWHQWEPWSYASGKGCLLSVLLEDKCQGKSCDDAYVTGTRGFFYTPIAGEEMNMLLADVAGTGDTHAVLQKLMVQTATGKLIAATGTVAEPFILLQALAALSADTLAPCMFTGY